MTAIKRVNVGLEPDEAALVERLKNTATAESTALEELTGITLDGTTSQARLVHSALVVGLGLIERRAEEIGYQRLAAFRKTDPEHQAWRASRRARRHRHLQEHDAE